MFGRTSTRLRQIESERNAFLSAVTLVNTIEYAAMTLDSFGRIRGCCAAAEAIFGASRGNLFGKRVSEVIAGLFREGSSPSYGARYLIYLSATRGWHIFEATDTVGRPFAVELNLIRTQVGGREMFVLNLRRSKQPTCP